MDIYNAFLSRTAPAPPEFCDMAIPARSREDARRRLAEDARRRGYSVEMSDTSEEVIITTHDGTEIVYYGFDI